MISCSENNIIQTSMYLGLVFNVYIVTIIKIRRTSSSHSYFMDLNPLKILSHHSLRFYRIRQGKLQKRRKSYQDILFYMSFHKMTHNFFV